MVGYSLFRDANTQFDGAALDQAGTKLFFLPRLPATTFQVEAQTSFRQSPIEKFSDGFAKS